MAYQTPLIECSACPPASQARVRRRRYSTVAAAATLSASLLLGCSEPTNSSSASLPLKECRVPGVDSAVKCGTFAVWENRESKTGRKIDLNIVVYPASARVKLPDPVFVLAGGPGQAATDIIPLVMPHMGGLISKRDIVFVDQRGTGKSNPLTCKFPDADTPDMADAGKRKAATLRVVSECRDTLATRADLTQYGTTTAMADLDEVRAALGYSQINLWGGSYGTRTAQEYLRRYPDHVRTVVLDGVASPSMALPATFGRDASAAMAAMFDACAKDANCNKNYPDLRARYMALAERLGKRAETAKLADPLTGLSRESTMSRMALNMMAFSTLYVPQLTAVLPHAVVEAEKGNLAPLAALTGAFTGGMEDKMAFGMRFSVVCAEDVPRIDATMKAAAATVEPFGADFINEFVTGCEVWPRGKVAPDFHTPVKSDKPVLILSGGLDPVTPPSFGEEVKKTFSNSAHVVAPNIGHGVSHHGCAPRIIKQFVEKASIAGIEAECMQRLPRPTFFQPLIEKPRSAASAAEGEKK